MSVSPSLSNPNRAPWLLPPTYMNPGGSTYGQNGQDYGALDPGEPHGDTDWLNRKADPAAFDTRSVTSAGITGTGVSGQPALPKSDGKMTQSAANLLARGPATEPPPGMDAEPARYAPSGSGVDSSLLDRQAQPPPGYTPPVPDTRADEAISRIQSRTPPQMIGQRDLQGNLRPQDAVDPNNLQGKEKLGAKVGSWGQRLAMAVLAATKLAPAAMQIVHPEYSQQMGQYSAAQAADTGLIKDIDAAENAKSQAAYRQEIGQSRMDAAELNKAKAAPHYGKEQVDPAYAKENMPWLLPEPNGEYWIDKTQANTLTKPIPPDKFVPVPAGGSLYDTGSKSVVATTPKPPVAGETPLGATVAQVNNALASRYAHMNKGPVPAYYQLPPTATENDAARISAYMKDEEEAFAREESRKQSEQNHQETLAQIKATHGDTMGNQVRTAAFKAYSPAMDSAERFNVMAKNYEDAVKSHDQQAMLSLLANHLGMTMGLQKGARLNQAIISEAQKSAPWLQSIGAKFDKDGYLSGVTLTPQQMQSMVSLGRDRFSEDISKARNEARYQGATDDGPSRSPNKATINFYVAQTHGDIARAKQLAAADGWSVQ